MALVVKDRVKETTATTGTGTLALAGAFAGFQSFSSALSDGDTTYYAIFESSTGEWEVGLGTFTASGTTLARTTVLASSNAGSAVNLTAGSAEVFITQPATKAAYFDGSGDLILNQDPTSALQAATKQYVDTIAAAGIHYHDPVRVEQEGNLNATYNNGTSGVGATLTNAGTQAALVIDGVTMVLNDRVLIYEQTNAAHNGVYTVTNVGSASTNWVLTRATDADSYSPSDPDALGQGDAFFVSEGAAGAGETYVMTTEGTITFGTTDITFSQISATQIYSAGNGLTLTGTTFAAGAGTGVTVNANDIAIGQDVGTTADVTFNSVSASLTGNVTGDVSGNAGTATALETARTIGGVSFDGTASINLPGVNTTGNQNTSGNAATATALATGRTISLTGDVTGTSGSFDGSGNVSIAATIAANSVALGTDTTGNYVADISAGSLIDVSGGGSETATVTVNVDLSELTTSTTNGDGDYFVVVDTSNAQRKLTKGNINISGFNNDAGYTTNVGDITGVTAGSFLTGGGTSGTVTVNVDATSANTANKVVARDGSGNFSAGTITAALSGNASTATALATGRTISLTGDVTGTSGSFDGSGNVSITTTIGANSVALGTDTTGNYVATIATGTGLDGSSSSEGGTPTITLDLNELSTSTTNGDGDYFVVVDTSGTQRKLTKANIALSGMNNDAGWTSNVGDITGVTAGSYITGGGTSGTVTVNVDATSANTASKVVARDASGNFSAGTITATLSGNATTATTATTANGVAANSVALGTDTTGNYVQQGATSGNGISGSVNSEGGTFTVTSNATNANTGSTIVFRDGSGNFSAGTITATLSGNATNISQYTINQNLGTGNSPSFAGLNINGNLNAVDDIYLADQIIHEGDTDTYMQFHAANQWRVVTGGTEMLEVNDSNVIVQSDLTVNGGDIVLGGTGRIQGIDTVSSGTDAANKTYVDNATAGFASTGKAIAMAIVFG